MTAAVSVQFAPVGKAYDFNADGFLDAARDDYLIVETDEGPKVVQVVKPPHEVRQQRDRQLRPVLRRATVWDMLERDRLTHLAEEALELCRDRVKQSGLPIKPLSCDYDLTGGTLTVSYSRTTRSRRPVHLRNLIRGLARTLGARVKMNAMHERQTAKLLDGVGKCGRQLCCTSWLREFPNIGIRMAKNQQMSLNTDEISGVCGRLLCCLSYEDENYRSLTRSMPKVGAKVVTPQGEGRVRYIYPLKHTVSVQLEGNVLADFQVDELVSPRKDTSCGPCGGCTHTRRAQAAQENETPSD